jgi:3-isopropylmalate dehydrogenase
MTGINHPKQAILKLRGWLGTYATLRPIKTYRALTWSSPLKSELQTFDMVVVHDHASGLAYGTPRGLEMETDELVARNTQIYTATEIARVARVAFRTAEQRQKRVLSADMSKLLETGQLWRDTVELVMAEFEGIDLERLDADNLMFNMVTRPSQYDVILAEATVGHLIAITAAGLTGSYAMHPAAYVGGTTSIFQPIHGSAADIAGKGTANPIGAIRAVAMLLDYAFDPELDPAAGAIELAVEQVLNEGLMPAEICPTGHPPKSTAEIGDAVIEGLRRIVAAQPNLTKPVEFQAAEPSMEEQAARLTAEAEQQPPSVALPAVGDLHQATEALADKHD